MNWKTCATALLAFAWLAGPAAAHQAETTEGLNPRAVPPAECVSAPRPAEQLAALLALDDSGVTAPAWPVITAPLGQSLDAASSVTIKEAVREILACFNAGDLPRAAALMTDSGVIRTYWQLTATPEGRARARDLLAAPAPRPERAQIRLVTTTDLSLLPDGRAVAFVVINDPLSPKRNPETLLFSFQHQDGAWLLDDWIDFSVAPAPTATPDA